jgi:perosamine synthetase
VSDPIPLSIPHLRGNEWKYLKECLDTNYVAAAGPFIQRFERAVAEFVGAPYAVAASSGTAAIHVALRTLDVGPEDAVLVPDFTFAASVNPVIYCGALPILLDVDRRSCSLDPLAVESFLEKECDRRPEGLRHRASGRRVRVILPVHLYGHPADLDSIGALAQAYGLLVVEDAAECLGAKYKGLRVGGRGDLICFSFNGNKIITAGAGGMIVGRREDWLVRARHLVTQARAHPTEYVHDEIGFNYRMPALNAALGCAQMECLEKYLGRKRQIADAYAKGLAGVPGVTILREESWAWSSYWLNTILIEPGAGDVAGVSAELRRKGIEVRRVWPPLHGQPPYRDLPFAGAPNGEWLYARGLNLPSSVGLRDDELDHVVRALKEVLKGGRP